MVALSFPVYRDETTKQQNTFFVRYSTCSIFMGSGTFLGFGLVKLKGRGTVNDFSATSASPIFVFDLSRAYNQGNTERVIVTKTRSRRRQEQQQKRTQNV